MPNFPELRIVEYAAVSQSHLDYFIEIRIVSA